MIDDHTLDLTVQRSAGRDKFQRRRCAVLGATFVLAGCIKPAATEQLLVARTDHNVSVSVVDCRDGEVIDARAEWRFVVATDFELAASESDLLGVAPATGQNFAVLLPDLVTRIGDMPTDRNGREVRFVLQTGRIGQFGGSDFWVGFELRLLQDLLDSDGEFVSVDGRRVDEIPNLCHVG